MFDYNSDFYLHIMVRLRDLLKTFRYSYLITTLTYGLMDNFCPCFYMRAKDDLIFSDKNQLKVIGVHNKFIFLAITEFNTFKINI